MSGRALVDEFSDRAPVEGGDRGAAHHRLDQHQAEGLRRLQGIEQGARSLQQGDLGLQVGFAGVHHPIAVHQGGHRGPIVLVLGGGQDQAVTGAPGHLDGFQHSLSRGEPSEKE